MFYTFVLSAMIIGTCAEKKQPPNIILIVADDLGWGDVSFHGSNQIPTPNINALAYGGVILNNYYVSPICSPTRAALMTGRHPVHLGLQHGVLGAAKPYGLGLNETLLPQHLKTLGYNTHMVGKWHLGFYAKEFTPTYRGFDSHFGYWQGAEDYFDHTSWQGKVYWGLDFHRNLDPVINEFGQYSTEIFTREAENIINNHNTSKPLFLYFAHQAVHGGNENNVPLQVPQHYVDRFTHIKNMHRRKFAGMVAALDDSVGNVTRALHARGMLENSIIVFTTDNGGPARGLDGNCACNWPLRGIKHTLWEGGIRGVGFVWSSLLMRGTKYQLWEGGVRGNSFVYGTNIIQGQKSNHMMHVCDWLPTLVHAAGGNATDLKNLDGYNVWDSIIYNKKSPRTEILHNIDPTNGKQNDAAIRVGEYKLIMGITNTIAATFNGWYSQEDACSNLRQGSNADRNLKKARKMEQDRSNMTKKHKHNTGIENETLKFTGCAEKIRQNVNQMSPSMRQILKISKDAVLSSPVVVNCGSKPANASTNCDPTVAPCLYHIPSDPCEYHNIAEAHPQIVQQLLDRLHAWNVTAVPIKNLPNDPKGNPDNFDGIWTPWVNLTLGNL